METQIAWRVMADMFDDGSTFLASCGVSLMVKHSDLSERRIEVVWRSNAILDLERQARRL